MYPLNFYLLCFASGEFFHHQRVSLASTRSMVTPLLGAPSNPGDTTWHILKTGKCSVVSLGLVQNNIYQVCWLVKMRICKDSGLGSDLLWEEIYTFILISTIWTFSQSHFTPMLDTILEKLSFLLTQLLEEGMVVLWASAKATSAKIPFKDDNTV